MSNLVPAEWEMENIESILDKVIDYRGKSPPKSDAGVPLITAKNIRKGYINEEPREYIPIEQFEEWMSKGLPENGDIFITTEAPLGNVARVPEYLFAIGQRVLTLRAKKGILSSEFLLHVMQGQEFRDQLDLQSTGSTVAGIKQSTFRLIPLVLPPLPEQKKIAAILTSVDEVIEKTQAQIDKLKNLKTGMMQELLTRGVGVDGKPHTEFKDSPVGRIPKAWEVVKLDEVAVIQTGAAKSSKLTGDLVELPYLRVANVQDGYLDLSEIKTIKVPKSKSERFLLRENDVLVNEGGDFDKLGRGSIWSGQISPCVHQNHVFVVRTNTTKLDPNFFNHLSGSEHGKKYYMGCAKQTTNLASINSSQLKQFPVLLPSLEEQMVICQVLNSIDENISKKQAKLAQNKDLKKALMQDLLTGKKRVKVDS